MLCVAGLPATWYFKKNTPGNTLELIQIPSTKKRALFPYLTPPRRSARFDWVATVTRLTNEGFF